jgi:hypothetical protein
MFEIIAFRQKMSFFTILSLKMSFAITLLLIISLFMEFMSFCLVLITIISNKCVCVSVYVCVRER